jgi:protein TonB
VLAVGHASAARSDVTSANSTSAAAASQSTGPSALGTAPFAEAAVDIPARLLHGDPPAYTRGAEAAGVEAEVPLEIVIDRNGVVVSARAVRHAGYGLDAEALRGIEQYRFAPARRNGAPVAVRMRWQMRFQLR